MTRFFALAALSLALVPAAALAQHRGTPEQQRACRGDVARFCRHMERGSDYEVESCLRANMPRLRHACRAVLEGRG